MIHYLDEFRNKKAALHYAGLIKENTPDIPVNFMEICGGHTITIMKFGVKTLLPESIVLKSGPGCPVCVTGISFIDAALELSRIPNVMVTTFGDMMRVPGSDSSLLKEKSSSGNNDIRVCLSAMDAVELAMEHPDKEVVFLGIGFETTAPTIAAAIKAAYDNDTKNFSVLSAAKTMPMAMKALLDSGELNIQGFICPGHVSVITGTSIYQPIVDNYKLPCVITGFEPTDMLEAIYMLAKQVRENRHEIEIQYKRAVQPEGNAVAQQMLNDVFVSADMDWRGFGVIPGSGLDISEKYSAHDAAKKFDITIKEGKENPACICGDIMRGVKTPHDCKLFGKVCTPENPAGACMVSAEGNCGVYYKYSR